jgi:hypothetical protein
MFMQTRRALLLAASLGLVVSCDTADMSDPGGEEQEGTGVETPSGSDSSEGDSDSPVNKIHVSDSVKGALSRGEAQDLIVTLNAKGISQKSKVSTFASLRKAVMNDLAGIRANVTGEFNLLPYMVIRASDKAVLDALAASDSVEGVFDNQIYTPASAEVLTAINRGTIPASPAAGSGDGITVVVLDSNVDIADFTTGGVVTSAEASTITGDTGEASPTHGEAMVAAIRAVAPGVDVHAIDVAANNTISANSVLNGLEDALTYHGTTPIKAVNLSFAGANSSTNANCDGNLLHNAIKSLTDANIAVIAPAGNNGLNTQISEPACDSLVISVGATFDATTTGTFTKTDNTTCTDTAAAADTITCFSNYSSKLTLLAPGAVVDLTWDGGNNSTLLKYGTSYSAAFVTGAVAVLADTAVVGTQDLSWMKERLRLSANPMIARATLPAGAANKVLDVTASAADVCLTAIDDVTVDIAAAGTASSPIPVELSYNKTGCTLVTTGAPAWLTVTPATPGLTQEVTFAAAGTNLKTIRYATETCPSTDQYDTADRGQARCVKFSADASGTHDDRYVRVQQAADSAGPSAVTFNAAVSIAGGDEIITTADDTDTATTGIQVNVTANVDAVTDGVSTAGFQYCFSTSSSGAGCVLAPLTFDTVLSTTVTLTAGDGLKTVYLFVADAAGNNSLSTLTGASDTTTVDTQVPGAGTLNVTDELSKVSLSFVLPTNNGAAYTAANLYRSTTSPGACTGTAIKSWSSAVPAAAAAGTLTVSAKPADADTVVLNDGTNPAVTLAFDTDNSVTPTATLRKVDVSGTPTIDEVRDAIVAAINGAPTLSITATAPSAGLVNLVNDATGTAGNVAITDNAGGVAVTGMAGGVDGLTAGPLTFTETAPAITVDGTVTYYYAACVTDGAGNTSPGATASARPRADITAPTLGGVYVTTTAGTTGTWDALKTARVCADGTNGQPNLCYTKDGPVVEFNGLTGDATEYCYSNVQTACSVSSTNWATLPAPGACAAGTTAGTPPVAITNCASAAINATGLLAGSRTYYFYVRDAVKNSSPAREFALYYDTSAPPIGRISAEPVYTAGAPPVLGIALQWAGALDTGSKNNSYRVVAALDPAMPAAGCAGATDRVVATGATPADPFPTDSGLTAGDTWNYRVCLTDRAGNTSEGFTISAKVRGEVTGPVPLTTGATHAGIDNCSAHNNAQNACENANCHWTEGTAPPVGAGTCSPNMVRLGGSVWTKKSQVRTWFEAQDTDTMSAGMEVCASANSVLVRNCQVWSSYSDQIDATKDGYLVSLAGDGEKYVAGWVRDSWGNISDSNSVALDEQPYRDKINVDRTAPTTGTATLAASGKTVTISVTGIQDLASDTAAGFARGLDVADGNKTVEVYFLKGKVAPGPSVCSGKPPQALACTADMEAGGSASCSHTLTEGGDFSYRVCASDGDNWNRGALAETTGMDPKPYITIAP